MPSKKELKQVDEVVKTVLDYVNSGTTLHIAYAPSSIKEAFGVKSHIFTLAVEKLKHIIPVHIEGNGSYRQASNAHDWRADVYTFLSSGENSMSVRYNEHFFGRNGGRKRKCSQWKEYERQNNSPLTK